MGRGWCCQTGLNCRPLHYQWSALPLSYGSMPGIEGNRPKWPPTRRPVLATRAPLAQARGQAGKGPKSSKTGACCRQAPSSVGPGNSKADPVPDHPWPRPGRRIMTSRWPCGGSAGHCGEGRRNPLCSDGGVAGGVVPVRSRHIRRTDDEGRSRQACGKERRGCEGFTTGPAETRVARKSQAAEVAGPRAQRCRRIFRKRRRLPR